MSDLSVAWSIVAEVFPAWHSALVLWRSTELGLLVWHLLSQHWTWSAGLAPLESVLNLVCWSGMLSQHGTWYAGLAPFGSALNLVYWSGTSVWVWKKWACHWSGWGLEIGCLTGLKPEIQVFEYFERQTNKKKITCVFDPNSGMIFQPKFWCSSAQRCSFFTLGSLRITCAGCPLYPVSALRCFTIWKWQTWRRAKDP